MSLASYYQISRRVEFGQARFSHGQLSFFIRTTGLIGAAFVLAAPIWKPG
jgi:hypothetical protein